MNCKDCRRLADGDCAEYRDGGCDRYRPPRGQLHAWLCDTGESREQWVARSGNVAKGALKGTRLSLPHPYKTRTGELEASILRSIQDVLHAAGIWHTRIDVAGKIIRTAQGAFYGKSGMTGMADVLACVRGQMVSIEAKAPGGTLSPEQNSVLLAQMAAGAKVCICVDPTKLLAWLHGGSSTATTSSGIPVV